MVEAVAFKVDFHSIKGDFTSQKKREKKSFLEKKSHSLSSGIICSENGGIWIRFVIAEFGFLFLKANLFLLSQAFHHISGPDPVSDFGS